MSESTESGQSQIDESGGSNDVPDMSSSSKGHDPAEARKRANEVFNSLLDGRTSAVDGLVFESAHGEIHCTINLDELDLETRWDCVQALPDGMFRAANEAEEGDDPGDNIELAADVIPGGDGMVLMRLVIIQTLTAEGLSAGELESVIKNDLPDRFLIDLGMRIIEMSLDRGEITGFRLE